MGMIVVLPCIPFKHWSEDFIEFFFVAVAYWWYIIIKFWVHTVIGSSLDGISKNLICYTQKIVQVNLCNLPSKGEQKHFAVCPYPILYKKHELAGSEYEMWYQK